MDDLGGAAFLGNPHIFLVEGGYTLGGIGWRRGLMTELGWIWRPITIGASFEGSGYLGCPIYVYIYIYLYIHMYIYISLSIAIPKVQLCWGRACGPNQKEPHFEARTVIQLEMILEYTYIFMLNFSFPPLGNFTMLSPCFDCFGRHRDKQLHCQGKQCKNGNSFIEKSDQNVWKRWQNMQRLQKCNHNM